MENPEIRPEDRKAIADIISENFDMINCVRRLGSQANRTNLARSLGASAVQITRSIQDLRNKNALATASATDDSTIQVNPEFAYFLGIHIGSAYTRAVLSNFNLKALTEDDYEKHPFCNLKKDLKKDENHFKVEPLTETKSSSTNSSPQGVYFRSSSTGPRDFVQIAREIDHILNTVLKSIAEALPFISVCIAIPGIFDRERGVLEFCPNIKRLQGVNIANLISTSTQEKMRKLSIPWFIEHDTECTLVHERECLFLSATRSVTKENKIQEMQGFKNANKPNWAVLYYGSGIGSSFCLNNQIIRGACNAVGELGHIPSPFLTPKGLDSTDLNHIDLISLYEELFNKNYALFEEYKKRLTEADCASPGKNPDDHAIISIKKPDSEEVERVYAVYFYYDRNGVLKCHKLNKEVHNVPECECHKDYCMETAIRALCFDSSTSEMFLKKHSVQKGLSIAKTLEEFAVLNPVQYKLLKRHVSFMVAILVGVLNLDVLLVSGTTLCSIPGLQKEFREMKYKNTLAQSANSCEIEFGVNYESSSARGAAIAAFYKCLKGNRDLAALQPVKIFWKPLELAER